MTEELLTTILNRADAKLRERRPGKARKAGVETTDAGPIRRTTINLDPTEVILRADDARNELVGRLALPQIKGMQLPVRAAMDLQATHSADDDDRENEFDIRVDLKLTDGSVLLSAATIQAIGVSTPVRGSKRLGTRIVESPQLSIELTSPLFDVRSAIVVEISGTIVVTTLNFE